MIALLIGCLLGPFSTVYAMGPIAVALALPLLAVQLGVTLGVGVHPGFFTAPDKVTAALVTVLLSAYFLLLMYMSFWNKLEAFFCTLPWLRYSGEVQSLEGPRKYATRCPFTGQRPTVRCPCCEGQVHDRAFHAADPLVVLPVGETVLRWDAAKLCTDSEGDLKKVRRRMDQYLDFRGNTLLATLKACCVGCATWQRCFNLLPRMALNLALCALFFAFLPWAFASYLSGNDTAGPGPKVSQGGAHAFHTLFDVLAVLYAQLALMVQLHAFLRANEFLHKYSPLIPCLRPVFSMPKWLLAKHVLRAPWAQAI